MKKKPNNKDNVIQFPTTRTYIQPVKVSKEVADMVVNYQTEEADFMTRSLNYQRKNKK